MKRGLVFFFFLLLFSHCEKIDETLPGVINGGVPMETLAGNQFGMGNTHGPAIQPSLSREAVAPKKRRIKKRKARQSVQPSGGQPWTGKRSDSLFISHLKYLRTNSIQADLNEPVSRKYLFSPVDNRQFPTMITLGRESYLKVDFDNDILDYTDRFYTNGIKIEIISPGLQMNPLSRLMIPYWGSGTNYYGVSLVQNMFTPSTTKKGGILYGDRPYAAYLYVGSFKITNDPEHNFRQTSELDAGIVGPNSYGEWVQRSFHNAVPTNNEPLGWEYQVKNDLVLNYSITFEKGVFNWKHADLLLSSAGNLGTLYTNVSAGAELRTGRINPYFANLGVAKKQVLEDAGLNKIQFFFFVKGTGKLVGYDATLQGGLFNTSSAYILAADEISRMVFEGSGGVTFSCNGISLDVEQFILSPEFHNGWWHKWVHLALTFSL